MAWTLTSWEEYFKHMSEAARALAPDSTDLEDGRLQRRAEEHRTALKQHLLLFHSPRKELVKRHENPSDEYLLGIHFDPDSQLEMVRHQDALREYLEQSSNNS